MNWFRMHVDILDDPKMFELNDYQFRTFIKLLCIASKNSTDGTVSCTDRTLIRLVSYGDHTSIRALSCTLSKLHRLGIIDSPTAPFKFINWNKRQYKSDISTERVKKHRQNETVMKRFSNDIETPPYTDTDTDTDTERSKACTPAPEPDENDLLGTFPEPKIKPKKVRQPRSLAVSRFHELTDRWPNLIQIKAIDESILTDADLDTWEIVIKAWLMRGFNPVGVEGMLDWFRDGVPRINSIKPPSSHKTDDDPLAEWKQIEKEQQERMARNGAGKGTKP